ncbi:mitochondrial enolase superfamily member 1 isoform X2 [Acanthochromis polyacanthus]|uniref:mitochondrial enolase superfamily member 1 isoform X2 n=1 Tax=Acanthochromis polyacanthus TaxID=80966 RepID=UPI00223444C4|nr:mitochondrial enolase superfamily member 1 isoform X2 [Acanthochromis polyacanthus]
MLHKIINLTVRDVRFPTSLEQHGSDAMHTDPDYSAAYVVLDTDCGLKGFGLTFTLGKGTEIVVCAVKALEGLVVGKSLQEIVSNFRGFYRLLTSDGQMRWLGPEKGVIHLATAAVLNAVWDLWARAEGKPLWKLLVDMLCTDALKSGWTKFKVKVGADREDDVRRCRLIRQMIGPSNTLMIDANQRWDVDEAISWVSKLAEVKPLWIEEPTSPDDILGHATIAKALAPLGIGVATGEQCHNRVMFKQLLQASALQFVQIDSCRLGSVNENLAVLLMAHKFQVPVCPHAGGVGLCELVQHLILFDYICVSADLSNRMCEYVDHLHEHFASPVVIQDAHYMPPKDPGYSCEMFESSVKRHQFPEGDVWKLHQNK